MKTYDKKEDGLVYDRGGDEFYTYHDENRLWYRIDRRVMLGKLMRMGYEREDADCLLRNVEAVRCFTVDQVQDQCFAPLGFSDDGRTLTLLPKMYRS